MSLQATVVILDNSDFAINGDYYPNRIGAQIEAAAAVVNSKFDANPENTVGLATMGGRQVQILCTPSGDPEMVHSNFFGIKCEGSAKFSQAIQIANLSLKHRTNQNQRMRLVCFVASRISQTQAELNNLAKKIKKASIAIDIIAIGDLSAEQVNKLRIFHENAKTGDNCHLTFIESTHTQLRDHLATSGIIGDIHQFNNVNQDIIDPNIDPEMAEVLRISLLQQQERKKKQLENGKLKQKEDLITQEELLKKAKEISEQHNKYNEDKKKELEDQSFVNELMNNIEEQQEPLLKKENPDDSNDSK